MGEKFSKNSELWYTWSLAGIVKYSRNEKMVIVDSSMVITTWGVITFQDALDFCIAQGQISKDMYINVEEVAKVNDKWRGNNQ